MIYNPDGSFRSYEFLPSNPDLVLADSEIIASAPARLLKVSAALEDVIEANTLLSGIGFESGGLGVAHAIHNGLAVFKHRHGKLHGELVAFGTLVQLVLGNAPKKEILEVKAFMEDVGLSATLEVLGFGDITEEELKEACKAATAPEETIHNMPFQVTREALFRAFQEIGAA